MEKWRNCGEDNLIRNIIHNNSSDHTQTRINKSIEFNREQQILHQQLGSGISEFLMEAISP